MRTLVEWLEGLFGNRLPGIGFLLVGLFLVANAVFNWGFAGGKERLTRLWNGVLGVLLLLLAIAFMVQFG
jgi:hypothetical protein